MNDPLQLPQDTAGLRQQVLDWFMRRQREDWSAQDQAAFEQWLAADASHRAGFARWQSHWAALDAVPADTVARWRQRLEQDKARAAMPADRARRRFLGPAFATLAAAAVTGSGGWMAWNHWQARPVFTQDFATARGQQIEAQLPDGSRLRLDTATRLQVAYYRQRREVKLLDGQAVFSVQPDAGRPFRVLAGPVVVTVVGTQFSVRHTPDMLNDGGVRVAVQEGQVRVQRLDPRTGAVVQEATDAVLLTARQQVQADPQGRLAAVTAVPGEGIAPWREHRISFVDTPLAQAIAELERYGRTGLTVRDPGVAALRLSGTFDPRDVRTLRRILPAALPVRLQDSGDLTELLPVR